MNAGRRGASLRNFPPCPLFGKHLAETVLVTAVLSQVTLSPETQDDRILVLEGCLDMISSTAHLVHESPL